MGALAAGTSYRDAAEIAGVSFDTLARRLRADAAFGARLSGARLKFKIASLALIARAARAGQWSAAAWYLSRAYPAEFGSSGRDVAGPDRLPAAFPEREAAARIRSKPEAVRQVSRAIMAAIAGGSKRSE